MKGQKNMEEMFQNIELEEVGIPSKAILNFIKQLEENKVNIHGFMMLHEDKIFAEGYWKSYDRNSEHRMYSAGKSFTSIAIGLLQSEGKIKITDNICDYFKDKLPSERVHPYIAKTTIRNMLMMETPHKTTTYKRYDGDDWVKSFFVLEPAYPPGTIFSYDTSSTHVLSALVERVSNKSLMDYLREKLLNYMDFSNEARFLVDPMGVSQGGSGLICTISDLAKVAYLCTNNGFYKGKQLIPLDYLKEATSKQTDTSMQPVIDERQGYGYQFWQSRNNGFMMYGMGGQLAVCLPQHKITFVTMADTLEDKNGVGYIHEAFWNEIYPYIIKSEKI
jgi:CubicO group peptidase (beta-lactamase class C family)